MARSSAADGLPPVVTFVLVAALLGLAAASLLAPGPTSEGVDVAPSLHAPAAPPWLGVAAVLAFVGALMVAGALSRGRPTWIVGLVAVCLAVGTVVAYLFRFFGNASGPGENTTVAPQNPPSCSTDPSLCNYVFPSGPSAPTIAPWYDGAALYGVLLLAVIVAAILIPRAMATRNRHYTGRGVPEAPGAPAELTRALDRLATVGPADDARRRIIRAYGELLGTVRARLPDLETATPREIAGEIEIKFGIHPETAAELTALFEEARYSRDRPMAPDAVDRAEAALRRALSESAHRGEAAR
ncbi:MAG TPA: DUF4129 domain-containing protein [Thermoplasmata archaeon]|nr:DUF4129 domain-containing protein [Thermoplasmata archaeon]